MTRRATRQRHRLPVFLAVLALFVRMLIPPGFMPAGAGHAGLVICTGHGPQVIDTKESFPTGREHGRQADHVCVFGGTLAGLPPATLAQFGVSRIVYVTQRDGRPTEAWPGRGLAAPPPPAQAPPTATV